MKLAVIGAGRVDILSATNTHEIKDPFLVLCRALCPHFDQVSVEVNIPLGQMDKVAGETVLGELHLGYATKYGSFLDYFLNPMNFSPRQITRVNRMVKKADVVILRIPGPVVFLAYILCRLHKKPYLTFVASDLHQIASNLARASSRKARIKGWVMGRLCAFLKAQVIGHATRRLYLSDKMQTDYGDTGSDTSNLFATSIVEHVHGFTPTTVANGTVNLIFVGRLVAEKGLMELIDICNRLSKTCKSIHMDIVGDGREAEAFSQAFQASGHPNTQLTLHGWISDRARLGQLLLTADFCLLPSHNEGTPKVIFEAWASSTIFAGTRVGGIPLTLENGKYGILFNVGDTVGAADQIAAMIDDPAQIDQMNKIAVQKMENYTLHATAEKLTREIRACL